MNTENAEKIFSKNIRVYPLLSASHIGIQTSADEHRFEIKKHPRSPLLSASHICLSGNPPQ